MNVEEAKAVVDHLVETGKKGQTCPCCNQLVQSYKRMLRPSMVRWMFGLYDIAGNPGTYVHSSRVNDSLQYRSGGEFSLLRWWGLIDQKQSDDKTKKSTGYWRLTSKGYRFLFLGHTVRESILLYNNRLYAFQGDLVSARNVLESGRNFNYEHLIGRTCK